MKDDGVAIDANGRIVAGHPEKIEQCAGAIICANKSHKLYRDEILQGHQKIVLSTAGDIMDVWQFLRHHKVKP